MSSTKSQEKNENEIVILEPASPVSSTTSITAPPEHGPSKVPAVTPSPSSVPVAAAAALLRCSAASDTTEKTPDIPAKDFFTAFFLAVGTTKRRIAKSIRTSLHHSGLCKLCPTESQKRIQQSDSYFNFKQHIIAIHPLRPVNHVPYYEQFLFSFFQQLR
ncbi:hypothetical protein BV898_04059 [Hypsibius exemplaris]|uniref:Uncharacterized protein n=1 Tax=Hypsibius exemplaris TaxID=2072580 RepID=A0A1W0X2Z3_HYPEX|nr:hypothetical protein BV898_04059 [Hypsibius exemplaris]